MVIKKTPVRGPVVPEVPDTFPVPSIMRTLRSQYFQLLWLQYLHPPGTGSGWRQIGLCQTHSKLETHNAEAVAQQEDQDDHHSSIHPTVWSPLVLKKLLLSTR